VALAEHLDVPLRERNTLLLSAGFAPRFTQTPLDDPAMVSTTAALRRLLDTHEPYPGLVLDRHWNVVLANRAAGLMVAALPAELTGPPVNVFRASLHPDGLAAVTSNFDDWATYLLTQLHRLVVVAGDRDLADIEAEVTAYPNVAELRRRRDWTTPTEPPALLIPCQLRTGDMELSLFTTLTTFGTPRDITLDELAIELFFPADDATKSTLHAAALLD